MNVNIYIFTAIEEETKRIEIEKEYLLQQAFENAELFNAKAVALAETSAMLRQQAEAEWETVTDEETGKTYYVSKTTGQSQWVNKYNSEWKSMHRVMDVVFRFLRLLLSYKNLFWSYRHVSPLILKSPKQVFFNVVNIFELFYHTHTIKIYFF